MRSILKTLVLVPVVLVAAVVATNTAMAEVTVKVPFTFSVAGKQCPAGIYTVQKDPLHGLVKLQSQDNSRIFNWVLGPGDSDNNSKIILKFDDFGANHQLRSLQYGSLTTATLDRKHSEREDSVMPMGEGR